MIAALQIPEVVRSTADPFWVRLAAYLAQGGVRTEAACKTLGEILPASKTAEGLQKMPAHIVSSAFLNLNT